MKKRETVKLTDAHLLSSFKNYDTSVLDLIIDRYRKSLFKINFMLVVY
ncbi:MAG: hypothetical protein ACFFDN_29065 [Candidatus Hodarchaeota archaeon]